MGRNDGSEAKEVCGNQLASWSSSRPQLKIVGVLMKWIGKEPFEFLGQQLCTDASDEAAWN